MAPIKPYTIHIPDSKITRLQQKLSLTDFPTYSLEEAGWKYGTPLYSPLPSPPRLLSLTYKHSNSSSIKTLHEYWLTKFSWREKEAEMNKLPNFKTQIEVEGFGELDIHFLHQKSEVKGAVPLLFVHGWPGSFLEVARMLPFLKGEFEFVFVVFEDRRGEKGGLIMVFNLRR
jgi:pimeloyl-ACP methyl ester carboxylesterase